jgi:hypothetical protein
MSSMKPPRSLHLPSTHTLPALVAKKLSEMMQKLT